MKSPKISLRRSILPLLIELDRWMEEFHSLTRLLADPHADHTKCVHWGAEKRTVEGIILGIAFRINKASKGIKE